MERKYLLHNVIQTASEFNGRRLFKRFTNFDCFAVRLPANDELALGSVMGDAGEQFGLSLFRGPAAVASLSALLNPEGPGDDAVAELDMLSFSMEPFGDLSPDGQALIREAGLHPRHDEPAPSFLVKRPGRQLRPPKEAELTFLLNVLRGAIEADQRKLLHPATLDDEQGLCVLTLSGKPDAPVSVTRERLRPRQSPPVVAFPSERPNLDGLPRLDATWLVGLPVVPGNIQGDDREVRMLLIVDEASGYIHQGRVILADKPQEAIKAIVDAFHGGGQGHRSGLPRKMVFSSRCLYDAMAPILAQAGVKCSYKPTIPELGEVAADFFQHMGMDAPPFDEYVESEPASDAVLPAPDDLAGWKATDKRLFDRCAGVLRDNKGLRSRQAAKRYFGNADLEHFLTKHKDQGVAGAYAAWGVLDYRPGKSGQTQAERMLAEGLPEAEALLLRARTEAHPTLYRIAGHDPASGTVDLEDVLLGGAVTVNDQLLSENIDNGLFIAARVFPAGRFHFLELAGPPLGAGMGSEAVDFLRDSKLEFTRDGLRRDAHKFGWLWDWIDWWEANWRPPQLRNTDGDELLWHTASFTVANQAEVRQALLQRDDIEHDEENEEFVWATEKGQGAKMLGGSVTLGRIEFVGDELVLSVNSAKRFAAAREWLEKLPGVVFQGVTTRRLDQPDKDRPLDERISKPKPVEMTPELTAAVQEMMNKQYMDWLDTPLAALGGQTPRQSCRTPGGRQQVAMLIRTIPDPMGPAPVHVPRQAMLAELGMDAGLPPERVAGPQKLPASEPAPTASPDGKVGRNDPCPCGSGKKYKKCCGR